MLYRAGFELTTLVVIGTDCIGSYKSNYHTIMTTTAPVCLNIGISWRHFKLESLKACILKGIIYNSDGESCAVLLSISY